MEVDMIIYKVTNKINGKVYIGQTTKTLEYRKMRHRTQVTCRRKYPIHYAFIKHGFDNFDWEILDTATTREELDQKEIHYISLYKSYGRYGGYNMNEGGNGNRGYKITDETRQKMIDVHLGNTHTDETRQKMSDTRKGKNLLWINPTINFTDDDVVEYVKTNNPKNLDVIAEHFGCSSSYLFQKYKGIKKLKKRIFNV